MPNNSTVNTAATTEHRIPKNAIILILGFLATIDPFSIDFYLPAFSQIAKDIGTTSAKISFSITSYFIGLAIGQIFYGPIVDRYGRKRPLYIGLSIYVLTCIGCMQGHSVEALVIYRFLQALAGSVAAVAAFSMVRDFFPVEESPRIFSLLMLIIGISPLAAPSLGGLVATWVGWQGVFIVLAAIVVVITLVCYFYLPPGAKPDPTVSLKPGPIINTFLSILKNPQFITYTISGSFAFATLFIYVAGSPVIFMDVYKVSPKAFGGIFSLLSCGFIASNQLNILLLKKLKSETIFKMGLLGQVVASAVFLIGAIMGWFGLVGTIVMFFLCLSTIGLINPNAAAMSLAPFKNNIGSASSLMGFLQIGIAGTLSAFIGLFNPKNIVPVPAGMLITGAISLVVLLIGSKFMAKNQLVEPDAAQVMVH